MFSSIKKIFDTRFNRQYSFELASIFAQNATFSEYTSQTGLNLVAIVDSLYNLSFDKLKDLIPTIKPAEYNQVKDSHYAIVIRCYATYDTDDIVYGLSVWLKTDRGWKTFDSLTNCWSVVKYIPYDNFYVHYRDHHSQRIFACDSFDETKDFYFFY